MASADFGPTILHPLYNAVNFLCQPVIFYTTSTAVFFAALRFRKFLVRPPVAMTIGILAIVFLGLSLLNGQFYREATKSDNVPIWIMLAVTSVCVWAAFWQMVNNDERFKSGKKSDEHEAAEEKLHVWPYLLYIEGIIAAFVLALLFIWSLGLDAPLEMFANPAKSPNPAKAPWYFLGLQELLVYYDPWIAGVVLPLMIIMGLIALPYCDPNPKGVGYYTFEQRKFAITTYLFGYVMMWLVLIFVGTFLRGQNWNFFGLYEQWDPHKVISANNINLSQFFWQDLYKLFKGAGRDPQDFKWYVREIPGFIVLIAYFTVVPFLLSRIFKDFKDSFVTRYGKIPGLIRYTLVIMFLMVMLAVPIKMYLRWAFNLKYIVFIPEYFLNI
jgi:hypothetical protein